MDMNSEKILLLMAAACVVIAGIFSISAVYAQSLFASTLPFSYSPSEGLSAYYNEFQSHNGIALKHGSITNSGNFSADASIDFRGRRMEAFLLPEQTWSFYEISGILFYSSSSEVLVNSSSIEYYQLNQWLVLGASGKCYGNKIYAYSPAPSRMAGASVSWEYDYSQSLLSISLYECPDNLIIDFSFYPAEPGTVFLEDFTGFEELSSRIAMLNNELAQIAERNNYLAAAIADTEQSAAGMETNISAAVSEKNSVAFEIESRKSNITDINRSASELSKKVASSTVLTTAQFFIIIAILLALVAYVALFIVRDFFGPKKVKK